MSDQDSSPDSIDARLRYLDEALKSGRIRRLKPLLNSLNPPEIARLLESSPRAKRALIWRLTPEADRGETLKHVADEVRSELIDNVENHELLNAVRELAIDDLADLIADLPDQVTSEILDSMDSADRQRLDAVLIYPPDTAGGLMNNDTVAVRPDVSLEVVQRYLRQRRSLPANTETLFVVSRYGRFLGLLTLAKLVTVDSERDVSEVMNTEVDPLPVTLAADETAKRFQDMDLISAPVVDENEQLVGRITVDDVVDVIRDQAERNIMRMAGLDEESDVFAPIGRSTRQRAVWLGLNLITALVAAQVVGLFQDTLAQVVALAVLMPIVPSMGGIYGTQTLTVVIRGLALGQLGFANARELLLKELAVGSLNGILWGIVIGAVSEFWFGNPVLGVIIALAMMINLVIAALAGVTIPLAMKRVGIDPALAGAVVLTTVTDVVGFACFLGLGALFLTG